MNPNNIIALGWELLAATLLFWLQKPIMIWAMGEATYRLRRNAWLFITTLVFISPNFWIFALGVCIGLVFIHKREHNPLALFLTLVFACPFSNVPIPRIAGVALIDLNFRIILLLVIILPTFLSNKPKTVSQTDQNTPIYFLVFAFAAMQIAIQIPYESITNTLRRIVEITFNTILVYAAAVRLSKDKESLNDSLYSLTMSLTLLAGAGFVEYFKSWLPYADVSQQWSRGAIFAYTARGGEIRATGTIDSPIMYGTLMGFGLILSMYLYEKAPKNITTRVLALFPIFLFALFSAKSRAPWIATAAGLIIYTILSPNSSKRISKALGITLTGLCVILLTPYADKIKRFFPYIGGEVDANTVYREQMSAALWELTMRSPLTGNIFLERDLEHLRQGQGIIDLLNVYLVFSATYGLLTAGAFCLCILIALSRVVKHSIKEITGRHNKTTPISSLVCSLLISHSLLMISMSYLASVSMTIWVLLGISTSRVFFPDKNKRSTAK